MKKLTTLLLMTVLCLNTQAEDQSKRIDLSGTWQFALDRERTIKAGDVFTETVQLPGTTAELPVLSGDMLFNLFDEYIGNVL